MAASPPSHTPAHLLAQIAQGMGQRLHWFPDDVAPTTLAETMVGMANTQGGAILLGITRTGRVQGVSNAPALFDRIFQAALLSDPPLVLPMPALETSGRAQVMAITVPRGLPNVYSVNGHYLGRTGRQTTSIPAPQLRALLLERGVLQFESRIPPHATLDDLDFEQVEAYLQAIHHAPGEKPEDALLRRGCLQPGEGGLRPTYAALLLFGRHPQQWLPGATLLAARFSGIAFADQYLKQDIGGTLPQQLRQAEQFARDNVRRVVRLVGLTHQETPEYPPEAVRELLVNAVAHRDYNIQGDNIHLHIFADRLEVLSPGGLPGPVTLDNLLEARFSRNPITVQVLSDLGFVERLGYGIDRVMTTMKQNGLPDPRFEENAGRFRAALFTHATPQPPAPDLSRYQTLELNPRQTQLLNHLAAHPRVTNRAYQQLCPDVHPETLRRDLANLVQRGVLLKIGAKRATYYILKDK